MKGNQKKKQTICRVVPEIKREEIHRENERLTNQAVPVLVLETEKPSDSNDMKEKNNTLQEWKENTRIDRGTPRQMEMPSLDAVMGGNRPRGSVSPVR